MFYECDGDSDDSRSRYLEGGTWIETRRDMHLNWADGETTVIRMDQLRSRRNV